MKLHRNYRSLKAISTQLSQMWVNIRSLCRTWQKVKFWSILIKDRQRKARSKVSSKQRRRLASMLSTLHTFQKLRMLSQARCWASGAKRAFSMSYIAFGRLSNSRKTDAESDIRFKWRSATLCIALSRQNSSISWLPPCTPAFKTVAENNTTLVWTPKLAQANILPISKTPKLKRTMLANKIWSTTTWKINKRHFQHIPLNKRK